MLTAACILAFLLAVPWRSARSLSWEVSKSVTARLGRPRRARDPHYLPACWFFQWVARQVGRKENREMASVREVEQATNRQRLLLVAGKAGLKPKQLKKIKAICAKYRDALDERSRRGRPDSSNSAALP